MHEVPGDGHRALSRTCDLINGVGTWQRQHLQYLEN